MPKRSRHKAPKKSNDEKVKDKLKAMISKTQRLQQQREQEADLLKVQQEKLQSLLGQSKTIDGKKFKHEIKGIAKGYKDSVRKYKTERKERLRLRKEQRRREKEEIKKQKQEYYNSINLARIETLPSKTDINGSNILNIYVDGWNILSCDAECRKKIRRKKKQAISIFMTLLNEFITNKNGLKSLNVDYNYNIEMSCLFDGKGENKKDANINIIYTGKGLSVDDKLVDQFNKIENKNDIKCNLVITSDRELTYRLYKTGVYVMKSSTFYKIMMKIMLKQNVAIGKNDNKEEKKQEKKDLEPDVMDEDEIDDELAKRIAMKMNLHSDEENNNKINNNPDVIGDNNNNNNNANDNNNNNNNISNPTDVMEQGNDDNYTFNDDDEFDEIFDENMDDIVGDD